MAIYTLIRINRDSRDTYAALGADEDALDRAIDIAIPDAGDDVEWAIVEAKCAGAARLVVNKTWSPMSAYPREI